MKHLINLHSYLKQNLGLGNACSIQLSYVVTPSLIKYTATAFQATFSILFTDIYRDLPPLTEMGMGKHGGEIGVSNALV